jgi:hypothetical protein
VRRQADGLVQQRLVFHHLAAAQAASALTMTRGAESSMRGQAPEAKPPNTTEWMAPMRVQASIAKAASGIIGM